MSIQLSDLLQNLYGVKTFPQINKLVDEVDATVTQILSANPNRVSFTFVNLSAVNMWIGPHSDVSSTKGIFVSPNGGSITLQWDRDFELVSQPFFAIAIANNSDCYILENISI